MSSNGVSELPHAEVSSESVGFDVDRWIAFFQQFGVDTTITEHPDAGDVDGLSVAFTESLYNQVIDSISIGIEVTIRSPAGGDDELVTCVEERLARATGVTDVTVNELHGVKPKLSATIVTVGVTIETCSPTADSALRDRFADVPGVESVDRGE